jgi:hypothetical protein
MKIIFTIILINLVSCVNISRIKKQPTPVIDNSSVDVVIPLTTPSTTPITPINSQYTYDNTTTIALILGSIVLLLSFAPLVIMYITLLYSYIKEIVCKLYNSYK